MSEEEEEVEVEVEVEERVAEEGHTFEAVSFQDLEVFEAPSEPVKKSWGVRRENLSQSQLQRTNNPTEEKIAKEIRELKEREEELGSEERESVTESASEDEQSHRGEDRQGDPRVEGEGGGAGPCEGDEGQI